MDYATLATDSFKEHAYEIYMQTLDIKLGQYDFNLPVRQCIKLKGTII